MNPELKFIIDKDIPFIKGVLEPFGQVEYLPASAITKDAIKDADALIIRTRTKCNEKLLQGTKVKMIATATIGMDHIDQDYCLQTGIHVTNAPGCNSGSVMQYIASVLVRLSLNYQFDLDKMVLGVIGHGNVGSKVAKMARILGMKVLVNDPPLARKKGKTNFCTLEEIQNNADIISLHVPLNLAGPDKTLHLVNRSFIDSLKKRPFLINSSRGEVVDEFDLKNGLKRGKIKDVVLDVWHEEPNIDRELLQLACIATPHIAGYSADGKANGTSMSIQAISSFFKLGLDKWIPSSIPIPVSGTNILNQDDKTGINKIHQAILQSYDILKDDAALRNDPGQFEKLRAEYPVRREFQAYRITTTHLPKSVGDVLKSLGFGLIQA